MQQSLTVIVIMLAKNKVVCEIQEELLWRVGEERN